MKFNRFEEIEVWKLSRILVKEIYGITNNTAFSKDYGLKDQIRRSAVSIPSNIAEGSSRTDKSFSHFIDISLGSSFELATQLIIARHKNYIDDITHQTIENKLEEFQRMAMGFQNGLQ